MKKKAFAALAAVSMMSMGLAGCSSSDSGSADNSAADGAKSYNVGVVQLVQHEALDAATEGFQEKLTELIEADGATVTFDVQNAGGDSTNAATIANGFVANGVDLIMANATPALQAAAAATTEIPILGTSVTNYAAALDLEDGAKTTGVNISGTADLAPLDEQAQMVMDLVPDAKKVGILYSSAEANSVYQVETITPMLEELGFEVKPYTIADTNEIAAVTKTAVDEMDVLYIPTDNMVASATATVNEITEPAKMPIIAGEEGICTGAGVATMTISYKELGEKTAQMAYDILVGGEDPSTMEIQFADATKKAVVSRAEAFGLTVPEGYEEITATEAKNAEE